MQRKKFVKLKSKDKKLTDFIADEVSTGRVTAYVKHSKTGAMIPLDNEFAKRMRNGEAFEISDAERKYNRRFFKVEKLSIRWDMEQEDILDILLKYDVPCFFLSDEVKRDKICSEIGAKDVCAFEEYILAIEEKKRLKKTEVPSRYIGFNKN